MQAIYPTSPSTLTDDDLAELYSYPVERTWLRTNFVSTLDGAVQGEDDRAGSLSDLADQRVFALLRSLCDVVLVGAGTARAEGYAPVLPEEVDAELRRGLGLTAVPALAVVSRALDLPEVLVQGGAAPTLVVTCSAAPPDKLADLRAVAEVIVTDGPTVDVAAAVDELSGRGHRRILAEGGPRLMHDLVAADRCDELCLTVRALLAGGERHRMLRGAPVTPPVSMLLRHVLEDDGTLFCRYTRPGG